MSRPQPRFKSTPAVHSRNPDRFEYPLRFKTDVNYQDISNKLDALLIRHETAGEKMIFRGYRRVLINNGLYILLI